MNIRNFSIGLVALLLFTILSALFTVDQTKQALVLQFGEPKRIIQEPGLAIKLPFIQDVEYYEKRVLSMPAKYGSVHRAFVIHDDAVEMFAFCFFI